MKIKREKTFIKDLKNIKITNEQSQRFLSYISKLMKNEKLPQEAFDHSLIGNWKDFREFHIAGDLIVIYKKEEDTLILVRIGTHAQIFEN